MNSPDFNSKDNNNHYTFDDNLERYRMSDQKRKSFSSRERNTFERYIENLRSKPENTKRKILFFGTFFTTFLIVAIWFVVYWAGGVGLFTPLNEKKEIKKDDGFGEFDSFGQILKDIEEEGKKILNVFSTTTNDIATTSLDYSDSEETGLEEFELGTDENIEQQ